MKRDTSVFERETAFDCVVIGGGIYGTAVAYHAARSGLSVLLVEKKDFGWATSSQSARIAHSGMRYLQHLDVTRLRESVLQRDYLRSAVGYLTKEVPFLLATYTRGLTRTGLIRLYLRLFDILRDYFLGKKASLLPTMSSRYSTSAEMKQLERFIGSQNLAGGVCWTETQVTLTERLIMSYLHSATALGAYAFNYCAAKEIEIVNGKVTGLRLEDQQTKESYRVKAKVVVNAAGPWVADVLDGASVKLDGFFQSKALTLVTSPLDRENAISFNMRAMYKDAAAVIDKGSSVQFVIPWLQHSMIASMHLSCETEAPDEITITESEIENYIALIRDGMPGFDLKRQDVKGVLWGMIPAEKKGSASPLKHYKIIEHHTTDGIGGLITVIGVKFTTAGHVAQNVVTLVCEALGVAPAPAQAHESLWGGGHCQPNSPVLAETVLDHESIQPLVLQSLMERYGSEYRQILAIGSQEPTLRLVIEGTAVLGAEVAFAVREEAAVNLADFVYRRSAIGFPELPCERALVEMGKIMAAELGWTEQELVQQVADVHEEYSRSLTRYC